MTEKQQGITMMAVVGIISTIILLAVCLGDSEKKVVSTHVTEVNEPNKAVVDNNYEIDKEQKDFIKRMNKYGIAWSTNGWIGTHPQKNLNKIQAKITFSIIFVIVLIGLITFLIRKFGKKESICNCCYIY